MEDSSKRKLKDALASAGAAPTDLSAMAAYGTVAPPGLIVWSDSESALPLGDPTNFERA